MRQNKNEYHKLAAAIRRCCQMQPVAAFSIGLAVGLSTSPAALAGPEGGVVTAGTGTITQNDAATTIDQGSNFLRIDWQSFNVAAHESVLFQQPNSSAVALNQIHDQSASRIYGTVQANGQIFLINSNGILFGRTAQVNVGSLVASSLDVMSYDEATGHFSLGGKGGTVVNDGTLVAARGGSISLIGGSVSNNGLIVADFGVVNLAAGATATLDFYGDGLMRFEIDGSLQTGSGTAVNNAGTIQANGGQVFLTAEAAHGVFDRVINNDGVIRANRIENVGGTIRLLGPEGTVINSGTLDASGVGGGSTGGTVSVLGDQVGLFGNASVNVSGDAGGGTALIGGDYQGRNADILNASRTFVSSGSRIDASARVDGDGGKVVVWADDTTRFQGLITARGAGSGNGGFAEVSGKETLLFRGFANLGSTNGRNGRLLLDPRNISIQNGGTTLDLIGGGGTDDANNNRYAFAEDPADDVTIDADVITALMNGGTDVELQAHTDISVNEDINASGSAVAGAGLILRAGDDITLATNVDIITANGNVSLLANDAGGTPAGAAAEDPAVVTMGAGSTIQAGTGAVTISSEGDATITTITTTGNVSVTSTAGSIIDDGVQATRITGNLVTLTAATNGGAAAANDDIDTNATSLTATATTGNLFVAEQDSIILNAVTAGGNVNIAAGTSILDDGVQGTRVTANGVTLTAATNIGTTAANADIDTNAASLTATATTGNIVVLEQDSVVLNAITAGGNVTITAGTSILDDDNDATDVAGTTITLAAATRIGSVSAAEFLAGTGSSVDVDTTGALDVTVTADNGEIHLNLVQTPTVGAANITLGDTDGVSGRIVLRSAGNLITTGFNANAIDIGLNNTASLALRSGGVLTLDENGLPTDFAPSTLLLAGTTDVVENGLTPRGVDITAGTLIFSSGSAGGNTALNTTVNSLSATLTANELTVIETDGLALGALSAQNITIQAAGAITDDGDNTTRLVTGNLGLIGTAFGAAGLTGQLDTTATNINADASAGEIFIGEQDGVGLTAETTNQNITFTAGGNVTLVTVNAGTGTVNINTGGGTLTDGGATSITAASALLNASTIGTGANVLDTAVTSLNSTSTGDQFITDGGTLNLTAAGGAGSVNVTSGGLMTVNTVTGANATLIANSGGMTLGTVNVGAGTANLTATGAALTDAADPVAPSVTAATLNANAASIGSAGNRFGTNVNVLGTTTTGNQFITEASDVSVTAAAGAGAVDIASGGPMTITSVTGSGATLASNGDMTLGTVNVGGGTASLTATGGALTDAAGTAASVTAATLNANAASIGSAGNRFGTSVATLNTTSTAGQFITEADGVALTAAGGAGAVDVTSGGAMTVNTVTGGSATLASTGDMTLGTVNVGGGIASLTATGGALTDAAGTAASVTAATLNANAASIGSAGNRFGTNVAMLNTTSTAGQFITEADGVALTAAGGAGTVEVTSGGLMTVNTVTGANATLIANSGGMTLGTVNVGGGIANLTATGGALTDAAGSAASVTAATLNANAASIGSAGNRFGTSVATLNTTSTAGQFITEADGVALTAAGGAGAVDVTSGGAMTVNTVTGGSATLASTGDMTLGTVNVGGGIANLTATGGALTDGAGPSVTAGSLVANASTIGTSVADRFDTAVSTLTATTTGNQFVANTGNLALTASAGAGAVNVTNTGTMAVNNVTGGSATLSTTGDMTLTTVTAGGAINLVSTTGQILDDGSDATALTGGSVSLLAATNLGSITDFLAGTGSSIDVNTAGALSANAQSSTGDINLNLVQIPTVAAGGITLGSGVNRAGEIIVQSAGNLNASAFAPGAINIGAGNTTQVGLRSGNILTLPAGGLTDAPAGTLLVQGTTDVIDSDAGPASRVLSLTANSLIFNSGAAGGNVTLNTSVTNLDAAITGASDLTVVDSDALNLGTVNAGVVTLVATAVTDGAGTSVNANSLNISADTIGSAANRLNTAVNSLSTVTTGNQFVIDAGTLNLSASAGIGAVDVASGGAMTVTNVSGASATLTANSGGMTLGNVNVGAGTANLTATGGALTDAAGNAPSVTAANLNINAATIGTAANRFGTGVGTLTTTTTGDQFIAEADAVALTAAAGVGAVDVTSGGAMTVAAVTGGSANLASASGGMTLGTVNVGAGNATLAATGGALTDAAGNAASVTAGTATLNAATIGTATNRFGTNVATLNTNTTGNQFIAEADAVTLTAAAGAGAIDVTSGGAMTVVTATGGSANLASAAGGMTLGTVNVGAGAATLTATAGALTDAAGNAASVTAGTVTLNAGTIGTAGNRFGTAATSLNATSTGDQFIAEADAVTLTAAAGAGAVNVTSGGTMTATNVTGGSATLASTGNMSVGTVNVGGGAANLTATGGTLTDGAGVSVTAGTLTANANSIGTSAADRFETAVTTLNTTTTGNQFLSDQGTLALNAAAGAGLVDATSTGAMTASVTGGSTTLTSSGGMTLGTVTVTGAASLSTTGALTDSGGAGNALAAGAATLTAGSIGTAGNRLNTAVTSLTASTSAGGMFIAEANDINLGALSSSGVGNAVDIQATGAIVQQANFTSASGPIAIDGRSINMNAATSAVSNGGAIRYIARDGNIRLSLLDANTGNVFVAAGQNIVGNGTADFGVGLDVRGGRVDLRAGGTFTGGTPVGIGAPGQGIDVVTTGAEVERLFLFIPTVGGAPISQAFVNFAGGGAGTVALGSPAPVNRALFFDPGAVLDEIDEGGFIINVSAQNSLQQTFAGEEEDDTSIDWSVFDANVSLFGTVGQPVRLPADQLEEEEGTQVSMILVPAGETLVVTHVGLRRVKVYRALVTSNLTERS